MIALNATPVSRDYDGPDDIEGEIFAVPPRTHQSTLAIIINANADPGDFSFIVEVSIDGDHFITLDTITNAVDTEASVGDSYPDFAFLFVKVSQTTKDNDVVSTVQLVLV